MTVRAFGWKQDAPDARDFNAQSALGRFGAHEKLGSSGGVSMRQWRPYRTFQGAASSCVSFAFARVINLFHRIHLPAGAAEPPMPAQRWIYNIARRQEHAGVDPRVTPIPPLSDDGCFPRLATRAVRALGFVPADRLPYDAALVNEELDPLLIHEAVDQSGLEYMRVFETGRERARVVRELLRTGTPVMFGLTCDTAYLHHTGEAVIEGTNTSDKQGGHMQAVLGVSDDLLVDVDNWWHNWGDDEGTARLSADFFGSEIISDVYAIRSAPIYAGE